MKIQCNACEVAEAKVMCCADEAALCWACDEKVHAANKLAGKHQRVPLIAAPSPSRIPKCDICQEASGYFFCLEDRALLCRNCDVSVHTANSYVSGHRRYLVTGVQVGLEPTGPLTSSTKEQTHSTARIVESPCKPLPRGSSSLPFSGEANQALVNTVGSLPDWSVDDLCGFTDFKQIYGFPENVSSKGDSGKLGSSEGSPPYFPADEGFGFDGGLGQVPEISYNAVPEIPSPPKASKLYLQRNLHYPGAEHSVFVPDMCPLNSLHG